MPSLDFIIFFVNDTVSVKQKILSFPGQMDNEEYTLKKIMIIIAFFTTTGHVYETKKTN